MVTIIVIIREEKSRHHFSTERSRKLKDEIYDCGFADVNKPDELYNIEAQFLRIP